jgi:hypothetical protein
MNDKKQPSITQVIENPELLNHDNCWSFYDWFCKDSSLERRAKSMIPKLKFLVKMGIIDGDKLYVEFKNNCPCSGTTYDDMRFSAIKDSKFVGGVTPRSGHAPDVFFGPHRSNPKYDEYIKSFENKCDIWGFDNECTIMHKTTNWSTLKNELKEDTQLCKQFTNLYLTPGK